VIEASTREAYTYQINKHILNWFGPMRMNEIMSSHVREWVTDLQAKGVTPATIQKVRFILSAIFTTALNDVTFLHPADRRDQPLAAFAGLSVGLLVLKMTRQGRPTGDLEPRVATALVLAPPPATTNPAPDTVATAGPVAPVRWAESPGPRRNGTGPRPGLLRDASIIYQDAAARGERLSQRTLARKLRGRGHSFPNEHLRLIAQSIGRAAAKAA
jgi:hypothetical protein